MLSNLNEKYLLKFVSSANPDVEDKSSNLIELLNSFGVKISFNEENPVYDIIDKMEYYGFCHE